jgi:hypothetical protein
MILSGIIAASGKRAGPPSPDPPPAPVYHILGKPNADGTAGSTHNFQASNILAQRYTTGVSGRIVALLAYFHGTGTPGASAGRRSSAAAGSTEVCTASSSSCWRRSL